MRSKLLGSAAALTLTAGLVLASSAPASAQHWHRGWHGGWGWPAAAAAGIVGGAIAAATSPLWAPGYYDSYPGYVAAPYGDDYGYNNYGYNNGYRNYGYNSGYAPYTGYAYGPAPNTTVVAQNTGGNVAYCQARYRSYDPASGTFLGYDGQRHPCP